MDQERIRVEVAAKAMDKVKDLKNLVEELKANAFDKDALFDHLQKRYDELCALLEKAQGDAVKEFRVSSEFTDLLDKNYVVGFEDFCLDAVERFPEVDFSSIKLNIGAASSLIQTSSVDVNIEDDATTQLA